MKRRAIIFAVALFVVGVSAVTSQAQLSARYRAEIPFDFVAKGKQFAAGGYIVRLLDVGTNPGPLMIESRDGKAHRILSTWIGGTVSKTGKGKLTFMRIGDSYNLTEVSTPGYGSKVTVKSAATDRERLAMAKAEIVTINLSGE